MADRALRPSPDADPVYLYADVLVGIDPQRELNNGQPSLHFLLLAELDPAPGQHVVHIGAGTGYYSAILAQLAGPAGTAEVSPAADFRSRFGRWSESASLLRARLDELVVARGGHSCRPALHSPSISRSRSAGRL